MLTGHLLSEWATKRLRCAEYMCGERWVDLGPVDVIIVRAEAMKQDFMASHLPPSTSLLMIPGNRELTPRHPRRQICLLFSRTLRRRNVTILSCSDHIYMTWKRVYPPVRGIARHCWTPPLTSIRPQGGGLRNACLLRVLFLSLSSVKPF